MGRICWHRPLQSTPASRLFRIRIQRAKGGMLVVSLSFPEFAVSSPQWMMMMMIRWMASVKWSRDQKAQLIKYLDNSEPNPIQSVVGCIVTRFNCELIANNWRHLIVFSIPLPFVLSNLIAHLLHCARVHDMGLMGRSVEMASGTCPKQLKALSNLVLLWWGGDTSRRVRIVLSSGWVSDWVKWAVLLNVRKLSKVANCSLPIE